MLATQIEKKSDVKLPAKENCEIWYDSKGLSADEQKEYLLRLSHLNYTGVLYYPENLNDFEKFLPETLKKILCIENEKDYESVTDDIKKVNFVIASHEVDIVQLAKQQGHQTCLRVYVDDAKSLHKSINLGKNFNFLMICFRDPTNIPLELVIASLQSSGTVLIKEISDQHNFDDAVVSLETMEVGADGVMFSPRSHNLLEKISLKIQQKINPNISIQTATILETKPVGMGYRSCIDLADLFTPTEGMIIGSTSQGGFLCCPEVFFLPYMDLRPFRINAGGVHSYVYNLDNKTNYMTELKSGSEVMVSSVEGKTHRAVVGRMKTEMRPLRLITAKFDSGEEISLLLQDDWHVRIFSDAGEPKNITELQPGDKILAHLTDPGRHVGIKISETIIES